MNKVILMGRLTANPETRYSQGTTPIAVVRFSLAVSRRFKRENESDVDFINCTAFGKTGEFINQYFKKGMMTAVVGRLQVSSYKDKSNNNRISTDVIVDETYFAESKKAFESRQQEQTAENDNVSYKAEDVTDEDDLPF